MEALSYFDLGLFVLATFAASLVAGLAGFAFGLIAAAVWLHILPPAQTAALIVGFGLVVQGYSVWKLRHAIKIPRLLPFIVGGAIGVPLGVGALQWLAPSGLRAAVGAVLIAYGIYGLARPAVPTFSAGGRMADGTVGLLNGALGGATGLAGILAVIWCGLRGWPKDEQRAVFQPFGVAVFAMTALWLGGSGLMDGNTAALFVVGLPAVLGGSWAGLKLYGRLGQTAFQKIALVLLLASGVVLLM
jgi:uncharacterized membrane protein YfcA